MDIFYSVLAEIIISVSISGMFEGYSIYSVRDTAYFLGVHDTLAFSVY
jgi:hypothetical protein